MAKLNFFADLDVLNCLLGMQYDKNAHPAMDLTVDMLDLPFWFSLKNEEKSRSLKLYTQMELYTKDESMALVKASVVLDDVSGNAQVQAPQGLGENMAAFYIACRNLSLYAKEKSLDKQWGDADPEQTGILLTVAGDELSWKLVSGMDRPELTVERMFGGTIKMRPYMDDFWDRSVTEMMSLEERIEKAEGGDKFAIAKLAGAYLNGEDGVKQNPEKAAYWYRKEAELQDSEGAYNLGLLYAKGFGVERDFLKAAEWMEKAVAWGDDDGNAPAKQYREMAENLKKAETGDAEAMFELAGGYMTLGGSLDQAGPGEDYSESLKWAQRAVDAGNPAGYWSLALAYEHGRGVETDDRKAVELYRKGAEAGDARCQHSYGCRLMTGEGVEKDKKQAFTLFKLSAEHGYGLAMRDVGRCYQFGEGCMGNMKIAVEWYEKALKVIDDPELARKTAFFRQVGENSPDWGQDFAGVEEYDPEEEQRKRAEEWKKTYSQYQEKDPRIVINGGKFVFTGILEKSWPEILEKMTAMGGLERTAVSGKTDYLVVDPRGFGESKVKAALEQRAKGKPVKIVLVEDFLTALGWEN